MKYCHHCGALLVESTASFCAECGKPLKVAENDSDKTILEKSEMETSIGTVQQSSPKVQPAPVPATIANQKKTQPPSSKRPSGYSHPQNKKSVASPGRKDQPQSDRSAGKKQNAPKTANPPLKRKKPAPKKRPPKKKPRKEKPMDEALLRPDPQDEHYDGYYDDVMPNDKGDTRERMDPEVIKRVAMISAGALLLIILSVVIMYVL